MKAVRTFLCFTLICSLGLLGCGKDKIEAPNKENFKPVDNAGSKKEVAQPEQVPLPPK